MKTVRFRDWDCVVEKRNYGNGRPALVLNDANDGEQIAVATVNLDEMPGSPNHVFIKDYSENEGMLKALTDAGVVRDTGIRVEGGFVSIPVAELQYPYREREAASRHVEILARALRGGDGSFSQVPLLPPTVEDAKAHIENDIEKMGFSSAGAFVMKEGYRLRDGVEAPLYRHPDDQSRREREPQQKDQFSEQLEKVRPITRNLIDSAMNGSAVTNATVIDFGLDSQKHYEALALPIQQKEIMPLELDAAMGHGEKLTKLAREASSNPHKDVQFYTSWDGMAGRPKPEAAMSEMAKLERTLDSLANKGGYDPADGIRPGAKDKDEGRSR
jgi:hypothetical protein